MDIRPLTPRYAVSPQIAPEDAAAIAAAGYTTLICNRPDSEVPPGLQADRVAEAAAAAGLRFHVLPLTHQTMTPDRVAQQAALVDDAEGPVLAYCASGTRCTVIWALSQTTRQPVSDILNTATKAGYDLTGLRPTLEAMATRPAPPG